eukprot:5965631-Amphidinium_carterae.1
MGLPTSSHALVWPMSAAQLSRLMLRAAALAGVWEVGPTLHKLRHRGASFDTVEGRRPRRYLKAGVARREEEIMGVEAVA